MAMGRPRAFCTQRAADRAMEVFWRRGYEGASIAELTQAMGINSPSLYAAYGSKEGLFRAALDRYDIGRQEFLAEVVAAPTARAVAERLLFGSAERFVAPDHPQGCMLLQAGMACGDGADWAPNELAQRRAVFDQTLRERFERGRAEGDLPADTDIGALTRYLGAVTSGMGVQAVSGATLAELRGIAELTLKALPV